MQLDAIFQVIILIMSVVIHEVSHGVAALSFGDPTAKSEGRLTLNPLKHLDLFGSVILPALLIFTHAGFLFGWAKPVPYNPHNLRNKRWGDAIVAIAGPLSNLIIAIFFGLVLRFGLQYNFISESFASITAMIVIVNLVLALFNLVPIPPLDGSKILFSFLPYHMSNVQNVLERYGFIFVIIFVIFLWQFVSPLIGILFHFITGITG